MGVADAPRRMQRPRSIVQSEGEAHPGAICIGVGIAPRPRGLSVPRKDRRDETTAAYRILNSVTKGYVIGAAEYRKRNGPRVSGELRNLIRVPRGRVRSRLTPPSSTQAELAASAPPRLFKPDPPPRRPRRAPLPRF